MVNTLIKNKDYHTVEIDNSEKDVIQLVSITGEMNVIFIERTKIKELIEKLQYIEAGEKEEKQTDEHLINKIIFHNSDTTESKPELYKKTTVITCMKEYTAAKTSKIEELEKEVSNLKKNVFGI